MQNMSLYDPHGFSNLKTTLILKLKYDDAKTKKQKKKTKTKKQPWSRGQIKTPKYHIFKQAH